MGTADITQKWRRGAYGKVNSAGARVAGNAGTETPNGLQVVEQLSVRAHGLKVMTGRRTIQLRLLVIENH